MLVRVHDLDRVLPDESAVEVLDVPCDQRFGVVKAKALVSSFMRRPLRGEWQELAGISLALTGQTRAAEDTDGGGIAGDQKCARG